MIRAIERFFFTSAKLPDTRFYVLRFEGTERINGLFSFDITVITEDCSLDVEKLMAGSATLTLTRPDGQSSPYVGWVSEISKEDIRNGYAYYRIILCPLMEIARKHVGSAILLDKDLKNTLSDIFGLRKYLPFQHEFRLTQKYPVQEFSMIYNESYVEYILWKLEEQGAYCYIDGDKVIFADSPQGHDPSKGVILYAPDAFGDLEEEEILTSFVLKQKKTASKVVIRNYNWQDPNRLLVSEVKVTDMDPPYMHAVTSKENVTSQAEADRLAKIRAEEIRLTGRFFEGSGNATFLRPGMLFTLAKHPDPAFNRDFMVTEISHKGEQTAFITLLLSIPFPDSKDRLFYQNSFTCIESDVQFRPERKAKRAVISGMIHGFIDGDNAQSPILDNYGRYKVLFPFDLSGRGNGRASCWIRRAQEQVGKDSGMTFPLLPGTEVVISFIDGNPDCPVISGALPNGETGSLSGNGNSNFSGIRTPGGAQLAFDNNHNAISLANRTGSGIKFGSGSLDYMETNTHIALSSSAIGATDLAGIFKDNISGFRSSDSVSCGLDWGDIGKSFAQQFFDSTAAVLSSISSDRSEKTANFMDWGGTGAKLIAELFSFIPTLLKKYKSTPYNVSLTAQRDEVKKTYQSFPTTNEFWSQFGCWFLLFLCDLGVQIADPAKTAASESDETGMEDYEKYLQECMQLVYESNKLTDQDELKKYCGESNSEGEYYKNAKINPCAYYSTAQEGLTQSILALKNEMMKTMTSEKRTEAEKLLYKLETHSGELTTKYNDACEGDLKKSEYDSYTKQAAWQNFASNSISDLLPEIASIYAAYKWMVNAKNNKVGGMLINCIDKNINIHAKTYLGQHAERGIYLNTTKVMPADWGAPCKTAATDLDPELKKAFYYINTLKVPVKPEEAKVTGVVAGARDFTIHEYLTPGHKNVMSGHDGDGIEAPGDDKGKNTFIASDTHLLYANNDIAVHNTRLYRLVQAPQIVLQNGFTEAATLNSNIATENAAIGRRNVAGEAVFRSKHAKEIAQAEANHTTPPTFQKEPLIENVTAATAFFSLKENGISMEVTDAANPQIIKAITVASGAVSLGNPKTKKAAFVQGITVGNDKVTVIPVTDAGAVLILTETRIILARNNGTYIDLGGADGKDEVNIKTKNATIGNVIINESTIKSATGKPIIFGSGDMKITLETGGAALNDLAYADILKKIADQIPNPPEP